MAKKRIKVEELAEILLIKFTEMEEVNQKISETANTVISNIKSLDSKKIEIDTSQLDKALEKLQEEKIEINDLLDVKIDKMAEISKQTAKLNKVRIPNSIIMVFLISLMISISFSGVLYVKTDKAHKKQEYYKNIIRLIPRKVVKRYVK